MSTEFQTLDKAKHGQKISFIGFITKIGDLKSGTGDKGDYTYKRLTIQDATASLELTVWNDEIKKFVLGGKYEIINAYAKEYKGKVGISIQYAEVKLIEKEAQQDTLNKETPEESTTLDSQQYNPPKEESKIPSPTDALAALVESETLQLLQIEEEVIKTLKHYKPLQGMQGYNGAYVGLFVKEIYRESKKVKFEKA